MKAIKNGKISASKGANGQWQIEPVELFRVYPQRKPVTDNRKPELAEVGGNRPPVTDNRKPGLAAENEILKEKLLLKDREIKLIEKRATELETDRDRWRDQAERLALTYQPAATQRPVESDTEKSDSRTPNQQEKLLHWLQIVALAITIGLVIGLTALFSRGG